MPSNCLAEQALVILVKSGDDWPVRVRSVILTGLVWMLAVAGGATAQTLYNSPGQKGSSSTPLNLRALLQGSRNSAPQDSAGMVPYTAGPVDGATQFAQKKAMLDQWRAQRDTQAQRADQIATNFAALRDAGPLPETQPPAAPAGVDYNSLQPAVPMIYNKPAETGTPRRLFNSIE